MFKTSYTGDILPFVVPGDDGIRSKARKEMWGAVSRYLFYLHHLFN